MAVPDTAVLLEQELPSAEDVATHVRLYSPIVVTENTGPLCTGVGEEPENH